MYAFDNVGNCQRLPEASVVSVVVCLCSVLKFESAVALSDEQRVPRNNDVPATESLSNGSDWSRSSGLTTNGNNTSDSLSQDDDLGQCYSRVCSH